MSEGRSENVPSERNQLREEAALWFARMRGEEAERHRAGFEAWLARGALHRAAYNRIGEIFAAGKMLKTPELRSDIVYRSTTAKRPVVRLAAGLLALSLLGLLAWQLPRGEAGETERLVAAVSSEHRGGTGRVESLHLASGSTAILDVDALLATSVGKRPNLSRLEQGRVRFEVPPHRPAQTVLAGPTKATSTGGTFDLWFRADGSLDAQVLTGDLELRPAVATAFVAPQQAVMLRAGQRYRIDNRGTGTPGGQAFGMEWPDGILEFRRATLTEVLAEANRYGATKIVLGLPELGALRVSGRFRVDDPARLADRLAIALSLAVDAKTPGIIVLRPR